MTVGTARTALGAQEQTELITEHFATQSHVAIAYLSPLPSSWLLGGRLKSLLFALCSHCAHGDNAPFLWNKYYLTSSTLDNEAADRCALRRGTRMNERECLQMEQFVIGAEMEVVEGVLNH